MDHSPSPGTKQLQMRQNQAKHDGITGMAAFIMDVCSTNDMSSLGRVSSGGSVGAMLCFLLIILGRRLGTGSLRRQHNSFEHKREQNPLQLVSNQLINCVIKNFQLQTCFVVRSICSLDDPATPHSPASYDHTVCRNSISGQPDRHRLLLKMQCSSAPPCLFGDSTRTC